MACVPRVSRSSSTIAMSVLAFKFADNDLMGFPYQVVLGKRGLKNGTVELKDRATGEREDVAIDEVVAKVAELVKAARR